MIKVAREIYKEDSFMWSGFPGRENPESASS
jgi:hypothetical protein